MGGEVGGWVGGWDFDFENKKKQYEKRLAKEKVLKHIYNFMLNNIY
jgi:hypothetical protein